MKMNAEARIAHLSIDPAFNILTRPALEIALSETPAFRPMNFYAIDLKDIHRLNEKLGYQRVNVKIRSILRGVRVLHPSVIAGRAFSGDEIVMVYPTEEWFFIRSIIPKFEREGIGFKYVVAEDYLGKSPAYYRRVIDNLLIALGRKQYFHAI